MLLAWSALRVKIVLEIYIREVVKVDKHFSPHFLQQGVFLIEVLVTVLLLATGLLGIASMQLRSLQQNGEALISTQANILAYDILEQARMASPVAPAAVVVPAADDVAAIAKSVLPGGQGTIECDAKRLCQVTISWSENVRTGDEESPQSSIFIYSATL